MGFGSIWVSWIKECLYGFRASILVNGSPSVEFDLSNGVKQGCPLSPFLFIIAMEPLSALISKMEQADLFKGFRFPNNGLVVSHLNFADDTIFFMDSNQSSLINLVRLLRCFAVVSGLKVNFHKSQVVGVALDSNYIAESAARIFCQFSWLPLMYLGLPLGVSAKCNSIC